MARVCGHFVWSPATVDGRGLGRYTGGYPRMPGGLGLGAVFVGPNPNGAIKRMARGGLEPATPRFSGTGAARFPSLPPCE